MTRLIIQAKVQFHWEMDLNCIIDYVLPRHWIFKVELYQESLLNFNPCPPRLTFHSMLEQSVGHRVLHPWLFSNVVPRIVSAWIYKTLDLYLRICNLIEYKVTVIIIRFDDFTSHDANFPPARKSLLLFLYIVLDFLIKRWTICLNFFLVSRCLTFVFTTVYSPIAAGCNWLAGPVDEILIAAQEHFSDGNNPACSSQKMKLDTVL